MSRIGSRFYYKSVAKILDPIPPLSRYEVYDDREKADRPNDYRKPRFSYVMAVASTRSWKSISSPRNVIELSGQSALSILWAINIAYGSKMDAAPNVTWFYDRCRTILIASATVSSRIIYSLWSRLARSKLDGSESGKEKRY